MSKDNIKLKYQARTSFKEVNTNINELMYGEIISEFNLEHNQTLLDALTRLKANPDFNVVITNGYLKTFKDAQIKALSRVDDKGPYMSALLSVSTLLAYLTTIDNCDGVISNWNQSLLDGQDNE